MAEVLARCAPRLPESHPNTLCAVHLGSPIPAPTGKREVGGPGLSSESASCSRTGLGDAGGRPRALLQLEKLTSLLGLSLSNSHQQPPVTTECQLARGADLTVFAVVTATASSLPSRKAKIVLASGAPLPLPKAGSEQRGVISESIA